MRKETTEGQPKDSIKEYELALEKSGTEHYTLRLYVAGMTPRSQQAIRNIKAICDEHLAGRCDLAIIDVYQQPRLAKGEQIIAAPTLIKKLPLPLRRYIGDLANKDQILIGLDIKPKAKVRRKKTPAKA